MGPIIPHIQPIRVLNGKRDELRLTLNSLDIQTGIHYKPNHLLSFYGRENVSLPISEQLYEELLSLPLHPGLTKDDVKQVCGAVIEFMNTNH